MFFNLDTTFGEKDLLPKSKPRGPKVSRKHREYLDLLTLIDKRNGNREEWGRLMYHIFVEVHDWRNGVYTARCGCRFGYERGNVYPQKVCDSHETIWDADFESEKELLIAVALKKAKAWYFQLPAAQISTAGWDQIRRYALIPEDFGFEKPRDWVGRRLTIDSKYGSCACNFEVRSFEIKGTPWQTRTAHPYLLIRTGRCGNPSGSCPRLDLPEEKVAVREINRIIKQYQ